MERCKMSLLLCSMSRSTLISSDIAILCECKATTELNKILVGNYLDEKVR